jgi:hypothetical protein
MDEKWFFAIVVRKHNKSVPFLGVLPVHHAVHHKSHIDKLMVIDRYNGLPSVWKRRDERRYGKEG